MRFAVQFSYEISFWDFMLSTAQISCRMSLFEFWPCKMSWDFLLRLRAFGSFAISLRLFIAFCWIIVWMIFQFFLPLWNFLMRFHAFCSTIFVRDFLMRVHAFAPKFSYEISCFLTPMRFPCERCNAVCCINFLGDFVLFVPCDFLMRYKIFF